MAKRQQCQQPTQQPKLTTALGASAPGVQYSVQIQNQSNLPWSFVVYQEPPDNAESLAWFASPFNIGVGSEITFSWNFSYQFVWASTGILKPGVNFSASGMKDCDPTGANLTHFTIINNTGGLSDPVAGSAPGTLTIVDGSDVPPNKYSVGVAMSQNGVFAVNAGPNFTHVFALTPSYWVTAIQNVKEGDVMDINTVTQNAELHFPPNVYSLTAILQADNTWAVVPN